MEFDPSNPIIQLCVQGSEREAKGDIPTAGQLYKQAWAQATTDFEKFTAAYFLARHQTAIADKLNWFETALEFALKQQGVAVTSALPSLYQNMAHCYQALHDPDQANHYRRLASLIADKPTDTGPFYHGTKADLQPGELLTAGFGSNYKADLTMNHIYFTALVNGAGLAAALAKGQGKERVYIVEPVGSFENDPNVTDKKFPGNPTRSYRTQHPLKITGEVTDWQRLSAEQLQAWRNKLAKNTGEIIN